LVVLDVSMGDAQQPGEVRIGRYVTSDVFLSIAQELGTRVGQAATIEYRLRPRVSVRLSTSTTGSSGIDVFWHRRY
jgi:autotransporter translocation and assembly factor TamB